VDGHYYSVPYQLVGSRVDVRIATRTVEIFSKSRRVASHLLERRRGGHSTEAAHVPESHRRHAEWTPSRQSRLSHDAFYAGSALGALNSWRG
jgi:hypothetical protein